MAVAAVAQGGVVDTSAVVANGQHQLAAIHAEIDVDARGIGVGHGIVHGLPRDPEQFVASQRIEVAHVNVHIHHHRHGMLRRKRGGKGS